MIADRTTMQEVFVRICQDCQFTMTAWRVAALAALILKCHPLEIWLAMPSYDVMEAIATGTHPAARKPRMKQ